MSFDANPQYRVYNMICLNRIRLLSDQILNALLHEFDDVTSNELKST